MSDLIHSSLSQEWQLLQQQVGRYESQALHIKLLAITLFALALSQGWSLRFAALTLCILWLQEAIFRTTQTRLCERLLLLESALRNGGTSAGMQLHSWWADHRGGFMSLLAEYAKAAIRPTVALPYFLLLAGVLYAVMR